jgi:hypothetical protein
MTTAISDAAINLLGAVVNSDKFNQLIHNAHNNNISIEGTSIYVESAKRILDKGLDKSKVVC